MFKNYFKIAFRNLVRQKGYSAINILGLAIGMTSCLLITLFVWDELSYDKFHAKSDRLYRAFLDARINNKDFLTAPTCEPMAAALQREVPEVESAARIRKIGDFTVRLGDRVFMESKFLLADSNFGQVLSLEFIDGDANHALNRPRTLIVTDEMALKYFGRTYDIVGKTLFVDNADNFEITGVVKKYPTQSHLSFDFLASMTSRPPNSEGFWISNNYFTYITIKPGASQKAVEDKLATLVEKYADPQMKEVLGAGIKQLTEAGLRYNYRLQKVTDIHLNSQLEFELAPNSSMAYVYVFGLIAVFILGIACINFMNLSTARSARRAKEVGVRKALGSNKSQLVQLFVGEAIMVSLIAMAVTIGLTEISLPYFNQFASKNISLSYLENPGLLWALLTFALVVGVTAGSYPAFFLSSFQPVKVLKGELRTGMRSGLLRSTLVIGQFAVSVILIVGTLVVFQQLQFIQDKDLGFNKERLVVLDNAWLIKQQSGFKTALLGNSNIVSASYTGGVPGKNIGNSAFIPEGGDLSKPVLLYHIYCDFDNIRTLGFNIKEGRDFSIEYPTDSNYAVVINESAARLLGYPNPIGRKISTPFGQGGSRELKIIGMVKDFHFESLHQEIRPLVFRMGFGRDDHFSNLVIRIHGPLPEVIGQIEKVWSQFSGGQPFGYYFVDENINHLYRAEQTLGKVFGLFAGLGIFIACLGLLGLAAYTAEQRTKEIGVRKVMGATDANIVGLLSKDFAKLVSIAILVAWPVAYFAMTQWLDNFAYRIEISMSVFIMSGAIAMSIALLTVSYQAIKAANSNPVDALKYE